MLKNIFSSPKTTLAGVLAIVVGALGQVIVPQVVVFLGMQPGMGWQLLGLALGAVVPFLMKDAAPKDPAALPPPSP